MAGVEILAEGEVEGRAGGGRAGHSSRGDGSKRLASHRSRHRYGAASKHGAMPDPVAVFHATSCRKLLDLSRSSRSVEVEVFMAAAVAAAAATGTKAVEA